MIEAHAPRLEALVEDNLVPHPLDWAVGSEVYDDEWVVSQPCEWCCPGRDLGEDVGSGLGWCRQDDLRGLDLTRRGLEYGSPIDLPDSDDGVTEVDPVLIPLIECPGQGVHPILEGEWWHPSPLTLCLPACARPPEQCGQDTPLDPELGQGPEERVGGFLTREFGREAYLAMLGPLYRGL